MMWVNLLQSSRERTFPQSSSAQPRWKNLHVYVMPSLNSEDEAEAKNKKLQFSLYIEDECQARLIPFTGIDTQNCSSKTNPLQLLQSFVTLYENIYSSF